ncbi:MAG: hypothetical protein ABIN94_06670 [Ferruginibacter sp.]
MIKKRSQATGYQQACYLPDTTNQRIAFIRLGNGYIDCRLIAELVNYLQRL